MFFDTQSVGLPKVVCAVTIFSIFYAMKSEKLQHWLSGEIEKHPVGCRAVETAKRLICSCPADPLKQVVIDDSQDSQNQ